MKPTAPWTTFLTGGVESYVTEISNRPTHCPVCLQGFQKHAIVKRWSGEGELEAHEWMCQEHPVVIFND